MSPASSSPIVQSVAGVVVTNMIQFGVPTTPGNLIAVYAWHQMPEVPGYIQYGIRDTVGNVYTTPPRSDMWISHNARSMQTITTTNEAWVLMAEIAVTSDHIPCIRYSTTILTPNHSSNYIHVLRLPRPPELGVGLLIASQHHTTTAPPPMTITITGPTLATSKALSFTHQNGNLPNPLYRTTVRIFTSSAHLNTYRISASAHNTLGYGSIAMQFYPLGLTGGWSETSWQSSWAMR